MQLDALEELVLTMCDKFQTVFITGDFNLDHKHIDDSSYYRHDILSQWLALLEELNRTHLCLGWQI